MFRRVLLLLTLASCDAGVTMSPAHTSMPDADGLGGAPGAGGTGGSGGGGGGAGGASAPDAGPMPAADAQQMSPMPDTRAADSTASPDTRRSYPTCAANVRGSQNCGHLDADSKWVYAWKDGYVCGICFPANASGNPDFTQPQAVECLVGANSLCVRNCGECRE